jgi:hypothetical protein
MNSENLVKAILSLLVASGLFYFSTTFKYDSDVVLSTSSYNDTVGPILLFASGFGSYGLFQMYKTFFK